MKFPTYNHAEIEPAILKYWQDEKIVEALRDRNKSGEKFYFLDGPPYTSGRIHLGHAWNKALKDMALRYKRMKGMNVWDRAGFDMHGLPTEHKVMKKFDFHTKEDIEKFGYDKFAQECHKFCTEMMHLMIQDFTRMGTTLDYSDPDQPIKNERMEAVWAFIKKAHEDNRLYLGKRTLHWDPKDQSALAKHELEYRSVNDTSIYVKFKVVGKENEYLLIWTTTPWSIPFDLFMMAHPELDYVKVKVNNEFWTLAKSRVKAVEELSDEKLEVVEEFKGEKLEGVRYEHFWTPKIPELKRLFTENEKVHTVILSSEYVNDEDGTGIVHGAPGCGPEDYEIGHQNNIPPFNDINEAGFFPESMGFLSGLKARTDDQKIVDLIDQAGNLVASKKYRHDYPHAERSKEAVIFRTTPQWFLKIEDIKEKMIANNEQVHWEPQTAKNSFRLWLQGLRDNSITKQRFWGTPVPIWQADDGDIIVVGSAAELKELAKNNVPDDLHKPWIDDVVIEKDGKEYHRLPDVLDVWIDPGCQSWIMLGKENMDQFYPTDFIVEGKDQIQAWFNLLWICSHLYLDRPAFKNVFMHGFLNDKSGVKMSKSLGNITSPDELIEKHGADVLRYYMSQTSAGEDINFSWDECVVKERQLHILWNMQKLLFNLCKENKVNPAKLDAGSMKFAIEEKYMFSRLHSTIRRVTKLLDKYRLDESIPPLTDLFLDLSRTYIQLVRDKSAVGSQEEKHVVIYTIYTGLLEFLKMFNITTPFISEAIYLNLKEEFGLDEKSISHYIWPECDGSKINLELEKQFESAKQIIQAALYGREQAKLGLRWPLSQIVVETSDDTTKSAVRVLKDIIMKQVNCKNIDLTNSLDGVQVEVKPDPAKIGKAFGRDSPKVMSQISVASSREIVDGLDKEGKYVVNIGEDVAITKEMLSVSRQVPEPYKSAEFKQGVVYVDTTRTKELDAEGYARELTRFVQNMRKKAGLEKWENIELSVGVSEEMKEMLEPFVNEVKEKVGAANLTVGGSMDGYEHSGETKVKEETFSVSFRKV